MTEAEAKKLAKELAEPKAKIARLDRYNQLVSKRDRWASILEQVDAGHWGLERLILRVDNLVPPPPGGTVRGPENFDVDDIAEDWNYSSADPSFYAEFQALLVRQLEASIDAVNKQIAAL